MDKFNNKMEKRTEKARQKAIDKWKKRNPGKSTDNLDVSALDETFFNSDSDGTFAVSNSRSFGMTPGYDLN